MLLFNVEITSLYFNHIYYHILFFTWEKLWNIVQWIHVYQSESIFFSFSFLSTTFLRNGSTVSKISKTVTTWITNHCWMMNLCMNMFLYYFVFSGITSGRHKKYSKIWFFIFYFFIFHGSETLVIEIQQIIYTLLNKQNMTKTRNLLGW